MARRKQEIALQQEIDKQEDWDSMLSKDGLIVVDVYQQWCGPCKAIEGTFRKIKMETGDSLLKYALAKADTIQSLEEYRGRCEPCFLFYAAKQLVAVVRGANAPVIMKTIQEQLAYEHKVLKGEAQRKPIEDPFLAKQRQLKEQKKAKAQVDHLMHSEKEVTICIIKPDMIEKGKKDEIIEKIKEKGYEILEQKELKMTEEQAKEFYKHKADSPEYESLIKYMTSNNSCILALTKGDLGKDVITELRDDVAGETAESLRAKYATDTLVNAVHASDSQEAAARELAFFFPTLEKPKIAKPVGQRTLALIRPSAYNLHKDDIIQKIEEHGFKVAMKKVVHLSKEQAEEFYSEHQGKMFFEDLVKEMSSGPLMVLCLVKEDAIGSWRNVLGPKEKEKVKEAPETLRHAFDVPEIPVNSIHGASTYEQAEKEIQYFFPMEQTIALIKPGLDEMKQKEIEKKIVDSGFIVATKKSEKLSDDIIKKMYENAQGKPYFNDLVSSMAKGEINVMVLSRENAVDGWREMIGNVDPSKAKEENPNSLRALFGEDILHNAVHGPSNKDQASHEIKLLFGDVKFDEKESNE